MRLVISLEDRSGAAVEELDDARGLLARLLPSTDDPQFPCLWAIDLYGRTVFNGIQAPQFLREWQTVASRASGAEERALVAAVEAMAAKVAKGPHLYLRFEGS